MRRKVAGAPSGRTCTIMGETCIIHTLGDCPPAAAFSRLLKRVNPVTLPENYVSLAASERQTFVVLNNQRTNELQS